MINEAERVVVRRFLDEDTLLEEFDRVTKDLNEIRDTRYGEFDCATAWLAAHLPNGRCHGAVVQEDDVLGLARTRLI